MGESERVVIESGVDWYAVFERAFAEIFPEGESFSICSWHQQAWRKFNQALTKGAQPTPELARKIIEDVKNPRKISRGEIGSVCVGPSEADFGLRV